MFNWLKRKKSDSDELELQNTSPPKIRQPTHAARDARMSIPVGEREYYDILEARKRAGNGPPSIGTSMMKGKGKGKARSPLAYTDSGEYFHLLPGESNLTTELAGLPSTTGSSTTGSPAFSVTTSYTSSYGYDADMGEFWELQASMSRRHSTAQTSSNESARDAVAKAKAKAKQSGTADGTA
jgi:hypothetical protein